MGNNIRAERARHGMSQRELADIVGVVQMSIVRWESGASEPSVRHLFKMAQLFGCTPEYLLDMVSMPNERLAPMKATN